MLLIAALVLALWLMWIFMKWDREKRTLYTFALLVLWTAVIAVGGPTLAFYYYIGW